MNNEYKQIELNLRDITNKIENKSANKECEDIGKLEIWKPIMGYEKFYQVSNFGRIMSNDRLLSNNILRHGRIMSPNFHPGGYLRIDLINEYGRRKQYSIHRIVALNFIPNPNNLLEVNHKNANKHDNCISNLEWISHINNIKHAINLGIFCNRKHNPKFGENSPFSKLTDSQVIKMREMYASGHYFYEDLCYIFKIKLTTVFKIINGITWKHIKISESLKYRINQTKQKNILN